MKQLMRRPGFRVVLWVLVAALYLVPLIVVNGAVDYFLKIEGVPGESADTDHKDWIDVSSFQWGVTRPVTGAGGARTNGPPVFKEVTVSKWVDKSSPVLMLGVCEGKVYPKVELDVVDRANGTATDRQMTYTLSNVLVTATQPEGASTGSDARPTESISLNFTKIEMKYRTVDVASGTVTFTTNVTCDVPDAAP